MIQASSLERMAQTSQTHVGVSEIISPANTRQSPFIRKGAVDIMTRHASSSGGSSGRSRNQSNSPTNNMRQTSTSLVNSLISQATHVSKDKQRRQSAKSDFMKFLDERATSGIKKSKQGVWKKFLNMKAGIPEKEIEVKKLPPIKLDSKRKHLSQDQQMTIALFKKLKNEQLLQAEMDAAEALKAAEAAENQLNKTAKSKFGMNTTARSAFKKEKTSPKQQAKAKSVPLSEVEILNRNDQTILQILQAKKSNTSMVGSATVETQQNLRRAIKEIEEQLAIGNRRQITGLQKWQLAVKFLAMNHDQSQYEYLNRYDKLQELNLNNKMTTETERLLEQKDRYEKKHQNGIRREQAKQLRLQKINLKIKAERNEALVKRDHESARIAEFENVYQKLMGDEDDLELPLKYIGKNRLAHQPSLNALSRIKEKYEDEADNKSSISPRPFVNKLNSQASQSTIEITDDKVLVSVNSQSSIGTQLQRVQSQKHCIRIQEGSPRDIQRSPAYQLGKQAANLLKSGVVDIRSRYIAASPSNLSFVEERPMKNFELSPNAKRFRESPNRHSSLRYHLNSSSALNAAHNSKADQHAYFSQPVTNQLDRNFVSKLSQSLELGGSKTSKQIKGLQLDQTNLIDQTMSLPQVMNSQEEQKPSLKNYGRLPGQKFKMQQNRASYMKDVQAMRIRMENQLPSSRPEPSNKSKQSESILKQTKAHHGRNQSAAQTTLWNHDIVQNMEPRRLNANSNRNSLDKKNMRLPPLISSPHSSGMMLDEHNISILLQRDGSCGSIGSTFRSERTQRTLDSIKDPNLRTERSLALLVTEIDDKVLNFSKQNINIAKAPKKGEYLYSHEVKPEAVKRDVIKLDDSLAKYEQIHEQRNSFAMGLLERSQKHRELQLRQLKRKYKITQY